MQEAIDKANKETAQQKPEEHSFKPLSQSDEWAALSTPEPKAAVPDRPMPSADRILNQGDQWAALTAPGGSSQIEDPLEETDLYATEKKDEAAEPLYTQTNYEEQEMDDDINTLLDQSFSHERRKTSFI